jgi:hypothetical protein
LFAEDFEEDEEVLVFVGSSGGGSVRRVTTPPSGGKWKVSIANRFRRNLNARSLLPPADNTDSLVLGGKRELRTGSLCTWKKPWYVCV